MIGNLDTFTTGIAIAVGAAIVGMFFRIEHRLTTLETTLSYIVRSLPQCQQHSVDPTP